jgi:hypothetical protein
MNILKTLIASLAASATLACSASDTESADTPIPPTPNVVTFTALDFAFDGPTEIPAGLTTFRLVAAGKEIHHLVLVKLENGKTFDTLMTTFASMTGPGPMPSWMVFAGGPNAPAPGMESNATMNLEPGSYALLCFVDTPDKVPHFMKGMSRPLTVTAGAPAAPLPEATITVTMSDYAFAADKPFTAGRQTIRAVNVGKEPHEIILLKLDEGKTVDDFGMWMATMQGPPPAMPMGGASPLVAGKDMQFDVDLTPGNYAMLCVLPDPTGMKMHIEHGMVHPFVIQ